MPAPIWSGRSKLAQVRSWETWDLPDDQVVVVHWMERDLVVVFPIQWAQRHGDRACIERAKERIAEYEEKVWCHLAPGSTLLAWSRHENQPRLQLLNPEVVRRLL